MLAGILILGFIIGAVLLRFFEKEVLKGIF